MSIVRVGATKQFADNWDNIFGGGRASTQKKTAKGAKVAKTAKKSAKKKPAKKKASVKPAKKASKRK